MKKNSLRNLPPILCRVTFFLEHRNRYRLFFITVMNHNTNDISQFCSMKRIKVFLLQCRSPSRRFSRPLYQLTDTLSYFWVKRGTLRGKLFFSQEHSTMTQSGLKSGSLDPESNAITVWPFVFYAISAREVAIAWEVVFARADGHSSRWYIRGKIASPWPSTPSQPPYHRRHQQHHHHYYHYHKHYHQPCSLRPCFKDWFKRMAFFALVVLVVWKKE